MKHKEWYIGIGCLVGGVALGVWFMATTFPNSYEGKTAYEWSQEAGTAEGKLSTINQASSLPSPYQVLISCLQGLNKYTDYSNGQGYYVNDVSDVNYCISQAQGQMYDNSSQILENHQQNP